MTHHHPHPHLSIVETTVEVEAPLQQVWDVVADPRNLPNWDRHIVAVRGVPDDGLAEGVEYTTELALMAVRVHVAARVVALRPPEHSRIRLSGVLEAWVETNLTAQGEDRTRLHQRVDYRFRGGPLGEVTARAVQIVGAPYLLKRGVLAQKRQAEHLHRVERPPRGPRR